ncbi:HNH endonuclease signature motif containing protein [Microbacterium sp. 22242]|uniref:HNH endonuclease signature motif containing protein n=1 Tax=Microbacterium sp. 22242 TaxID=3453896 RepID=UPI003F85A356
MKRFLRARDQRCRFPGCLVPAARCQVDHNQDYALGGATAIDNLACLCPGHHPLKHPDLAEEFRWSARQRPDGAVEWIDPTGSSYLDSPPRRVMFV